MLCPTISSAKSSRVWSVWIFGSLVTLSGLSCILGTFYDDEIYNIRQAALSFPNLLEHIKYINSTDIHPPASYLLNRLAFRALGSWKAVQFVNGTLNAAAIAWFYGRTADNFPQRERLAVALTLATAVTSQMWTTSLRWSAYFNPIFLVLYVVATSTRPSITARAAILTVGTVFLFHTAYLTAVAAPVLWGTFVATSFQNLRRRDIRSIAPMLFGGVIACLPQLYVLLKVHLPIYAHGHSFSIPYGFGQSISALVVGTAVFPIDYIPVMFAVFLATAFVASVKNILRDGPVAMLLGGALFGFALLVLSRLGFEGRNAVFLYPIALILIVLTICRSVSWIRLPAAATLVLLQTMSVYGFVFHRDTVKGSFNTPFAQAMREIASLSKACPGKSYVFTHDPVLTYLVEGAGGMVSSPYAPSDVEAHVMHEKDCVLMVVTYRGTLPTEWYAQNVKPLGSEAFRAIRTIYLGYDRFHTIKSWIANESFPAYYITIGAYDVLHEVSVPTWSHLTR